MSQHKWHMSQWRIAQARSCGTSHLAESKPCQDFCLVDFVFAGEEPNCLLIAVADGAGSAAMSEIGSHVACSAGIRHLKSCSDQLHDLTNAEKIIRASFFEARRDVEEEATRQKVESREMATTLLLAVVTPDFAVFGQVGDGVVIYGEPGELHAAHWAEQEALNLTNFITGEPLDETLVVRLIREPIHRIMCSTDGLTQILLDYRAKVPHTPIAERLFSTCSSATDPLSLSEDLQKFLDSDVVNERTDDDKTLVIAILEAGA